MTSREKIKYLHQYLDLEPEIIRLENEIRRWRSRAEKITPSMSLAPGGGAGNRIEDNMEKIIKFQAELETALAEAVDARRTVESVVHSVEDWKLRKLLRYRYIEGMTWEQVAVTMDLQYRWTLKLHGRALSAIRTL